MYTGIRSLQVLEGLYVGSLRDSTDRKQLDENKITHILSVFNNPRPTVCVSPCPHQIIKMAKLHHIIDTSSANQKKIDEDLRTSYTTISNIALNL